MLFSVVIISIQWICFNPRNKSLVALKKYRAPHVNALDVIAARYRYTFGLSKMYIK